jgi:hypothetical protein
MSVRDRSMTLDLPCHETATYASEMTGLGTGRARTGAARQRFELCENHSQLFAQIDRELVQDGWAPTLVSVVASV